MPRAKKSYNDLMTEVEKLLSQAEELKVDKLAIITKAFENEFKKKSFQDKVLKTDDAILKSAVKSILGDFDKYIARAEREAFVERESCVNHVQTPVQQVQSVPTQVRPQ